MTQLGIFKFITLSNLHCIQNWDGRKKILTLNGRVVFIGETYDRKKQFSPLLSYYPTLNILEPYFSRLNSFRIRLKVSDDEDQYVVDKYQFNSNFKYKTILMKFISPRC